MARRKLTCPDLLIMLIGSAENESRVLPCSFPAASPRSTSCRASRRRYYYWGGAAVGANRLRPIQPALGREAAGLFLLTRFQYRATKR